MNDRVSSGFVSKFIEVGDYDVDSWCWISTESNFLWSPDSGLILPFSYFFKAFWREPLAHEWLPLLCSPFDAKANNPTILTTNFFVVLHACHRSWRAYCQQLRWRTCCLMKASPRKILVVTSLCLLSLNLIDFLRSDFLKNLFFQVV